MSTAESMVAEAKSQTENLVPVDVVAALDGDTLLVDVREPGERVDSGSIPGDISAPRGMIEFLADPTSPHHRREFDPSRRVILYCASGGRSALAAQALQALGYTRVAHLDGGLAAWKEDGRQVEWAAGSFDQPKKGKE